MVDTTTKIAPVSPVVAARQGYWRGVFRRLLRDPGGLIVGTLILLQLALALFGPWLIVKDPYQTSMFLRLKPIGSDGFVLGSDELGRDMLSRLILGARRPVVVTSRADTPESKVISIALASLCGKNNGTGC